MVKTAVSLIAALCALAPLGAAAEQPILPGYWESENTVSFPINDQSTSRQCVTPQKVEQFLSGPSSRSYKCTYDQSRVAGGAVKASGSCVDKNGMTSTIAVEGTYAPEAFDLKAQLRLNVGGLGIPINAATKARRIAAQCPTEPDK